MRRKEWNVDSFRGQKAQIKLVDASSEDSWGYISFDDVRYDVNCEGTVGYNEINIPN